jgi:hypothetical protein
VYDVLFSVANKCLEYVQLDVKINIKQLVLEYISLCDVRYAGEISAAKRALPAVPLDLTELKTLGKQFLFSVVDKAANNVYCYC